LEVDAETTVLAACTVDSDTADDAVCPVVGWSLLGAMELTGAADGPPTAPIAPVASRLNAMAATFAAITERWGSPVHIDTAELVSARAVEAGWRRRGTVSVNGSAHLIRSRDSWLVANLSRPSDLEVMPAVLGREVTDDEVWPMLAEWAAARPAAEAVATLQALGIPSAELGGSAGMDPVRTTRIGAPGRSAHPPVVVDLSAMWAGPLAAQLLARAGARVITVADVNRPDGARNGPPRFFARLHAGHENVQLDFSTDEGRAHLLELVLAADIVIEASRPRALRRLGLIAEEILAARPGRTWLSITGYGRTRFNGNRVAFGDDAAVAGGLVAADVNGQPVFCADAIADPLTGLWAAAATVSSQLAGGGHLVDVAMAGVSAQVSRLPAGAALQNHHVRMRGSTWTVTHHDSVTP
jgi:hypothetical protein